MCGCNTPAKSDDAQLKTGGARFHLPDVSCGHCEKTIRAALPGAAFEVDLASHLVRVEADA